MSRYMLICMLHITAISLCLGIEYAFIAVTSNDRHGVSNYRPIECLFIRLFRLTTKEHQRSALPALCEENPPVTGGSLHKGPVTRESFPFDGVIMLWYIPGAYLGWLGTGRRPTSRTHVRGWYLNNQRIKWNSCLIWCSCKTCYTENRFVKYLISQEIIDFLNLIQVWNTYLREKSSAPWYLAPCFKLC